MEEKHTSEIINRFLFNLKEESSERLQQHEDMPGPCKTTTNEATWTLWKQEFPDAKFSSRKIGVRMYYMIS
jgi:hypothetical protein